MTANLTVEEAVKEATQWLDISMAPKDGTPIDIWVKKSEKHQYRESDARFEEGEWWTSDYEVVISEEQILGWMCIPKPPQTKGTE